MKKIEFKFKNLELVKGCVVDINMNGLDDDDFNGDGSIDQCDMDYYEGYVDGYTGDDPDYEFNNGPYQEGLNDGILDTLDDIYNPNNGSPGMDIQGGDVPANYICIPDPIY